MGNYGTEGREFESLRARLGRLPNGGLSCCVARWLTHLTPLRLLPVLVEIVVAGT